MLQINDFRSAGYFIRVDPAGVDADGCGVEALILHSYQAPLIHLTVI